jgi:hypothetical protein
MEFLLYLTPMGREIIQNVIRAKYSVKENVGFCRDKNFFGYVNTNKLVICTNNIKHSGNDVKFYVNETVYHEATHIAHMCRGYKPFYIPLKDMPLPQSKLQDIEKSVRMSTSSRQIEHEAYWMEDKPEQVKYVIQKYCF